MAATYTKMLINCWKLFSSLFPLPIVEILKNAVAVTKIIITIFVAVAERV